MGILTQRDRIDDEMARRGRARIAERIDALPRSNYLIIEVAILRTLRRTSDRDRAKAG
jgi:hypothetical protein